MEKSSETIDVSDLNQERANHSTWLERRTFRIVLISTFTALAIVLGYLLASIPNIELFTLAIFLSGFILGKRDGMIIGFLSSFIFCFFNPLGASPLPLLAFQVVHYTLTGLMGALVQNILQKKTSFKTKEDLYQITFMAIFGIFGALITTSFQISAALVDVLMYFGRITEFIPYFLTGLLFTIVHIVGNTLGFIFILPGLIQLIYKMLD
ncbi:MAG: ECF transporter S component [Candidatus Thorarchaeota archaeon]